MRRGLTTRHMLLRHPIWRRCAMIVGVVVLGGLLIHHWMATVPTAVQSDMSQWREGLR